MQALHGICLSDTIRCESHNTKSTELKL